MWRDKEEWAREKKTHICVERKKSSHQVKLNARVEKKTHEHKKKDKLTNFLFRSPFWWWPQYKMLRTFMLFYSLFFVSNVITLLYEICIHLFCFSMWCAQFLIVVVAATGVAVVVVVVVFSAYFHKIAYVFASYEWK